MNTDICHGCANPYDDCICEELDAERDEGKFPDCDPNLVEIKGEVLVFWPMKLKENEKLLVMIY